MFFQVEIFLYEHISVFYFKANKVNKINVILYFLREKKVLGKLPPCKTKPPNWRQHPVLNNKSFCLKQFKRKYYCKDGWSKVKQLVIISVSSGKSEIYFLSYMEIFSLVLHIDVLLYKVRSFYNS